MWNMQWEEYKHHENMAFTRMIAMGMPVNELPSVYNDFYPNKSVNSKLVHYIAHYKQYLP
jgi:hypothetical protein